MMLDACQMQCCLPHHTLKLAPASKVQEKELFTSALVPDCSHFLLLACLSLLLLLLLMLVVLLYCLLLRA